MVQRGSVAELSLSWLVMMCVIGEVVEGGWRGRPARRRKVHVGVGAPWRKVAVVVLAVWLVVVFGAGRAEAVPSVTYRCS
jgi:hypothetical protein